MLGKKLGTVGTGFSLGVAPFGGLGVAPFGGLGLAVSKHGDRFLMVLINELEATAPARVIVNWRPPA